MQIPTRILVIIAWCLVSRIVIAQTKPICVLDLTAKNLETTNGNLFSTTHILKSAGFSFSVTDSVNMAITAKIIIATANIETLTFNTAEKDSLIKFVARGGILIATNCKDPYFNSLFGISANLFSSARFFLNFNTADNPKLFTLFDEDNEKQIRLADPVKSLVSLGTRSYSLTTANSLAAYESGETAITHNGYLSGHSYLFGTQFKDVIMRPQVKSTLGASRAYSNNFEPGQDVFIFLIAAIIKEHLPKVVYKNTAPCKFKSALTITHDVDATTSMDLFDDYANYERINNYRTTYLITTHYMHDKLAKNFFDGYEADIVKVFNMGHDIQSHSVSHVPDFDNYKRVTLGVKGNTKGSYLPYYNGTFSSNVTVLGEIEVSHRLLGEIINKPITIFRTGYLAFHPKLINALDSLGVPFNTSHSANDVMTNFPFFSHTDLSMNGRLTDVLEIPNSISDVFMDEAISEYNYLTKVESWQRNFWKVYRNNLTSVLLIHPTRYYKLYAQQLFVNSLPQDVIVNNLLEYGHFWKSRNNTDFTSTENADTLTIRLSVNASETNPDVAFIVNNGASYSKIKIYSLDNQLLDFEKSPWEVSSVIMHRHCERPDYNRYSIAPDPEIEHVYIYPNPATADNANLHFELMEESTVNVDIVDMKGRVISMPFYHNTLNLGVYDLKLPHNVLAQDVYMVVLKINDKAYKLKWVNVY